MGDPVRILYVEDDPSLRDLMAIVLPREDKRFSVTTAAHATDGLDRLSTEDFDCVVSDYEMPGRTGIEFLETVRDRHPDLPFILYTGKGSEEVASDAIAAGVTDYLQKGHGHSQYAVLANRITNAVDQHRSKRALEANRERLSLLIDQSPLGVVEWNERFECVRLNDAAEEILGYSEAELAGRSWKSITPDSAHERVDQTVSALLEGDDRDHSVNENVRKDGTRIVCEWHNRVVRDGGDVVAVISQFQDVTKRTAREDERQRKERRYQAVFNDPNILVGLLDTDGTVLDVNRTSVAYVDATREELAGERFWETPWFAGSEALPAEIEDWISRAAGGEYVDSRSISSDPARKPIPFRASSDPSRTRRGASFPFSSPLGTSRNKKITSATSNG